MDYQAYINSDEWKKLRQWKLTLVKRRCEACRATKHLQVHHRNYRHLLDCTPDDLLALCKHCHKILHRCLEKRNLKAIDLSSEKTIAVIQEVLRNEPHHRPAHISWKTKRSRKSAARQERRRIVKESRERNARGIFEEVGQAWKPNPIVTIHY